MNNFEEIKEENISIKEKYQNMVDKDGYLYVRDFCWDELKRQCKSIAGLLDGDQGQSPDYNLGEGLNYKGESGNYSDMQIHIDDLEKFIEKVKKHYKES